MRRILAGLAIVLALVEGGTVPARAQDCCAAFAPAPLPPLSTNQITFVPVTVTNTGDLVWPGYGNTDFVLSYFLYSGYTPVAVGQPTLFPTTVRKGESITVQVRLQAPKTPGTYTVRWFLGSTQPKPETQYYYGSTTFDQSLVVNQYMVNLGALLSWVGSTQPVNPRTVVAGPPDPLIESMSARSSNELTGKVAVGGKHFGTNAIGEVHLILQDQTVTAAYPEMWSDTTISTRFDVSGETDQPAKLQVVRSDGVKSNEWPVMFLAVLQPKTLPAKTIKVSCASAWGTTDSCYVANGYPPDTFSGHHSSDCCVSGDSGSDTYALPTLQNGWLYDWVNFQELGSKGQASVSGFTPGASGHSIQVNWGIPLHGDVVYTLTVYIRGPLGVPFQ